MTQDAQHIQHVLDGVHDAWNAGDADALVANYADQVTIILAGTFFTDKAVVHSEMRKAFAGPLKGSRSTDEILSIRLLGDDAAVVIGRSTFLMPGADGALSGAPVLATWTLAKTAGAWRVEAYSAAPVEAS